MVINKEYPLYVQVYVDIQNNKLNRPFTYGVPDKFSESVYIGAAVNVPFGKRDILGYITEINEFCPIMSDKISIKPLSAVMEAESLWDREMIELAGWMERYYGTSFVSALKVLIPGPVRPKNDLKALKAAKIKKALLLKDPSEDMDKIKKKASSQWRILSYLKHKKGAVALSEITNKTETTHSALHALEKKGYISIFEDSPPVKFFHFSQIESIDPLELTDDQKNVYDKLLELYGSGKPEVALLHGITGSGKTEIYLQIIDRVLKDGREALVLVPEISLTPQAIERFKSRFGDEIAVLHSKLTDSERRLMWWRIRKKGVRVVLGARSAVFAPLENIGIIVVDEEHEPSYKQENDPRYHARQIAIKRAYAHNALVILGSATPSLEAYHRAIEGNYHYLELPRRVGQSVLPDIEIVNLKNDFKDKKSCIIGDTLKEELGRVITAGDQAILFINRRGFSAFLLCRECSNVIKCPYCDITLTYHKIGYELKCHHCNYKRSAPDLCPFCGGNKLIMPSYGIQKVEEELSEHFPGVKAIRMDRDTTRDRDAHYKLLKEFSAENAQVLIGTQMVAKGLDFPGVTLVGVLMADISMHLPDFHSLERTYQILTQVSGRAGRREKAGKVIIQTYNPDYPVIKAVAKQNYDEFFKWELENRRKLKYPPFSHIVNVLFTGENSEKTREYAVKISEMLRSKKFKELFYSVLGPAPCPLSRISSKYRWHVTLKGEHAMKISGLVRAITEKFPAPSGITCFMDVDPISIM